MEITIVMPSLVFPAVSLLFLSYTNKFISIVTLMGKLASSPEEHQLPDFANQMRVLQWRLRLIRWMQVFGVGGLLLCVATMFFIYQQWQAWAGILFSLSLLSIMISLVISLVEIVSSADSMQVFLKGLEKK